MRWAGHVARKDDIKNTYKVSVIKSNATLSATSVAVWQYEVLFWMHGIMNIKKYHS